MRGPQWGKHVISHITSETIPKLVYKHWALLIKKMHFEL